MKHKKIILKYNIKKIFLLALIIILSFSIYKIVIFMVELHHSNKENKEINDKVIQDKVINEELGGQEVIEEINFDKLLEINPDTKGWIRYNKINYPVVQTDNNNYYLIHSFKKNKNELGSVFIDYRNTAFNDKNTVIYGHNAINGKMFGALAYLLKKNFYNENKVIEIIDLDKNKINYQIFSYYIIEEENYYIKTTFNDDEEYQTFLNTIRNRSIKKINITPSINDQILTLSTCYGSGNTTKRIVVHAKRIK